MKVVDVTDNVDKLHADERLDSYLFSEFEIIHASAYCREVNEGIDRHGKGYTHMVLVDKHGVGVSAFYFGELSSDSNSLDLLSLKDKVVMFKAQVKANTKNDSLMLELLSDVMEYPESDLSKNDFLESVNNLDDYVRRFKTVWNSFSDGSVEFNEMDKQFKRLDIVNILKRGVLKDSDTSMLGSSLQCATLVGERLLANGMERDLAFGGFIIVSLSLMTDSFLKEKETVSNKLLDISTYNSMVFLNSLMTNYKLFGGSEILTLLKREFIHFHECRVLGSKPITLLTKIAMRELVCVAEVSTLVNSSANLKQMRRYKLGGEQVTRFF